MTILVKVSLPIKCRAQYRSILQVPLVGFNSAGQAPFVIRDGRDLGNFSLKYVCLLGV